MLKNRRTDVKFKFRLVLPCLLLIFYGKKVVDPTGQTLATVAMGKEVISGANSPI